MRIPGLRELCHATVNVTVELRVPKGSSVSAEMLMSMMAVSLKSLQFRSAMWCALLDDGIFVHAVELALKLNDPFSVRFLRTANR